ncbi:substrate-binding domain-containing protein [Candidatus Aerophobetes bacterium]|nr:substrate-binding domain-containing protein [Candidatus Aerophobetes bacterium]
MSKKRRGLVILLAIAVVISTLGFSTVGFAKEKPITIGFSVPSLYFTWFVFTKEVALDEAEKLGVKVVVYDGMNKVSKQISDIEDMIVKGVDGVLISPINVKALVPGLEKLDKAGIPCATFDRKVVGAPFLTHVGADNVEGGRIAAIYTVAKLNGKGKIIELQGTPGSSPAIDRGSGFHQVIKEFPQMKIVFSETGQFDRETGMRVMEDAITAHPDFDAVWAHNDDMMMGAVEAIESAGYDLNKVVLVSFDAIPDALEAIQEGKIDATIEQHPGKQVREAMRYLVNYIRTGEKPPKHENYVIPTLITKANLQMAEKYGEIKK